MAVCALRLGPTRNVVAQKKNVALLLVVTIISSIACSTSRASRLASSDSYCHRHSRGRSPLLVARVESVWSIRIDRSSQALSLSRQCSQCCCIERPHVVLLLLSSRSAPSMHVAVIAAIARRHCSMHLTMKSRSPSTIRCNAGSLTML